MYKSIISAAAAGAAVMLASPASAQWASQPYSHQNYQIARPYAYQGYNYQYRPAAAYGYNGYGYNGYGYGVADANFAATLRSRVQAIRSNIQALKMQRTISPREARRLDNEAKLIERHVYMASRNGIQSYDVRNLELRVQRLERNIAMESSDRNNRPGHYRRG